MGRVHTELGAEHPVLDEQLLRPHCRACGVGFTPGQTWCDDNHYQGIACVSCKETMQIVVIGELIVDVCLACRAAWFDEGELGATIRKYGADIRDHVQLSVAGSADGSFRRGAGGVTEAIREGASTLQTLAAAGENAVAAFEAVVGVLEAVTSIFPDV
jgi:Zn-finger nucleic acid-binding protein